MKTPHDPSLRRFVRSVQYNDAIEDWTPGHRTMDSVVGIAAVVIALLLLVVVY